MRMRVEVTDWVEGLFPVSADGSSVNQVDIYDDRLSLGKELDNR